MSKAMELAELAQASGMEAEDFVYAALEVATRMAVKYIEDAEDNPDHVIVNTTEHVKTGDKYSLVIVKG